MIEAALTKTLVIACGARTETLVEGDVLAMMLSMKVAQRLDWWRRAFADCGAERGASKRARTLMRSMVMLHVDMAWFAARRLAARGLRLAPPCTPWHGMCTSIDTPLTCHLQALCVDLHGRSRPSAIVDDALACSCIDGSHTQEIIEGAIQKR